MRGSLRVASDRPTATAGKERTAVPLRLGTPHRPAIFVTTRFTSRGQTDRNRTGRSGWAASARCGVVAGGVASGPPADAPDG